MANREKYPKLILHNKGYITTQREPGDPVRKIGVVLIDRSVFQHSLKERDLLKLAKAQAKLR
jgi:hypothetical protein